MKLVTLIASVFLVFVPLVASADAESDQNNQYVWCLIKRGVNPPNIPKADIDFCLRESGVEDPGDDARKEKGNLWRGCLIRQASKYDDGVSPASDVSRVIVGLCLNEWHEYVDAWWLPTEAKMRLHKGIERYAIDDGARAVLLSRKKSRKRNFKVKD